MFCQGTIKSDILQLMLLLCLTRVNYLIQASDDLQLAKDYIILEFGPTEVFIRAMQFTKAKALINCFYHFR
jgi:hypothetical protein